MLLNIECAEQQCSFIIDCGSDISVIKASKLRFQQNYNPNDTCMISGIGNGTIHTYGALTTNLLIDEFSFQHKLYIVNDNFPIPTDGILGRDFFTSYRCCIDYNTWILSINAFNTCITIPIIEKSRTKQIIPPRCEMIKKLDLLNLTEDMVTISNEIIPGLMYANCIINNENKFVKFINTTNENIILPEDFIPTMTPLRNFCYHGKISNQSSNNVRNERLLRELELNNIDPKIKPSLERLCMQYNDVFALENDNLSTNNFYEQEISLNDNSPVYIKNYRIPEAQKSEIDLQVRKMLDQKIIQNSTSPYNSPILLVPKKTDSDTKKWRLVVDFRQLNKKSYPINSHYLGLMKSLTN